MKRFKKWLKGDPMNIVLTAIVLSVLIMVVGFTGAAHWDAKRKFAYTEPNGLMVARWNAGFLSFVVYTRFADGREDLAHVGQIETKWMENAVAGSTGWSGKKCGNTWLWWSCRNLNAEETAELSQMLIKGRWRTGQGTTTRSSAGAEP